MHYAHPPAPPASLPQLNVWEPLSLYGPLIGHIGPSWNTLAKQRGEQTSPISLIASRSPCRTSCLPTTLTSSRLASPNFRLTTRREHGS